MQGYIALRSMLKQTAIVTVSKKAKIAMKLKFRVAMMMMMKIRSFYCVGRVSGYPGGGWRGCWLEG